MVATGYKEVDVYNKSSFLKTNYNLIIIGAGHLILMNVRLDLY
jgi:hypothetical protein